MDYKVYGILLARIQEWAAFPFSKGSQEMDITWQLDYHKKLKNNAITLPSPQAFSPLLGFPCGSAGKNPSAMWETRVYPWVGKIPWRRERLPTPVFWPGEFHGLYSPWGCKELDTTERLSFSYLSLLLFGTLHSNGYIFSPLPLASLLFSAICKSSSDNHFAFLHVFLVMVLIFASCIML